MKSAEFRTAKDAKDAKKKIILFSLGALGVLGGSKFRSFHAGSTRLSL
ncbi:hypothetical protein WME79_37075 [Sorangium sp. So ce726]